MSFCRYSQLLFRIPYLQNTPKMFPYSISGTSGFGTSSGTPGSEDGGDSSFSCSDDNPPCLYDLRKYSHDLPSNDVKPEFPTLPDIPTGVFRCTTGESLGMGVTPADGSCYQNPEYFSFHHMTYYDMHLALRRYRKTSPDTGRKK